MITLGEKLDKWMFKLSDITTILDADDTKLKSSDLKTGMNVEITYNKVFNNKNNKDNKNDKVNDAIIVKVLRKNTDITESKILNVYTNNKKSYILVGDSNDTTKQILFILADNATIKNKSNREIDFSDLSKGLKIRVEHSKVMTFSLPPQCAAYSIEVLDDLKVEFIDEAVIEEINVKEKAITVSYDVKIGSKYYENTIILTVDDKTIIADKNKKAIALKDLKAGMVINIKHELLPILSSPPKSYAHKINVVRDDYKLPTDDENCEIFNLFIKLYFETDKKEWINCIKNHDHKLKYLDKLDIEDFFEELFEKYMED